MKKNIYVRIFTDAKKDVKEIILSESYIQNVVILPSCYKDKGLECFNVRHNYWKDEVTFIK